MKKYDIYKNNLNNVLINVTKGYDAEEDRTYYCMNCHSFHVHNLDQEMNDASFASTLAIVEQRAEQRKAEAEDDMEIMGIDWEIEKFTKHKNSIHRYQFNTELGQVQSEVHFRCSNCGNVLTRSSRIYENFPFRANPSFFPCITLFENENSFTVTILELQMMYNRKNEASKIAMQYVDYHLTFHKNGMTYLRAPFILSTKRQIHKQDAPVMNVTFNHSKYGFYLSSHILKGEICEKISSIMFGTKLLSLNEIIIANRRKNLADFLAPNKGESLDAKQIAKLFPNSARDSSQQELVQSFFDSIQHPEAPKSLRRLLFQDLRNGVYMQMMHKFGFRDVNLYRRFCETMDRKASYLTLDYLSNITPAHKKFAQYFIKTRKESGAFQFLFGSFPGASRSNVISLVFDSVNMSERLSMAGFLVEGPLTPEQIEWNSDTRNISRYITKQKMYCGNLKEVHDRLMEEVALLSDPNLEFSYSEKELSLAEETDDYRIFLPEFSAELKHVGSEMNICVGMYSHQVYEKECIIVLVQNKLTERFEGCIELRERNGKYAMKQCKGPNNHYVIGEAVETIKHWVASHDDVEPDDHDFVGMGHDVVAYGPLPL